MTIIKISKNQSNQTLKEFLIKTIGDQFSSSKISKSIDDGNVKVNNKKEKWNYLLKDNDEIKIYLKIKKEDDSFLKAKNELKVVYEDNNVIVVNKPRGLVCQKDANEKFDTLNNRIKKYLFLKNDPSFKDAHLCHRLDKYTFGICIAGKNIETIQYLNKIWNSDNVNKYYKCLALGYFEKKSDKLVSYIMFNEQKQAMEIDKNNVYNKKIITNYKVLKQYKDYAELEVKIDTGKKHQIRVHLASINHPILGDSKYNKINNFNYKFPCLASYKIVFNIKDKKYKYLNDLKLELEEAKFK